MRGAGCLLPNSCLKIFLTNLTQELRLGQNADRVLVLLFPRHMTESIFCRIFADEIMVESAHDSRLVYNIFRVGN